MFSPTIGSPIKGQSNSNAILEAVRKKPPVSASVNTKLSGLGLLTSQSSPQLSRLVGQKKLMRQHSSVALLSSMDGSSNHSPAEKEHAFLVSTLKINPNNHTPIGSADDQYHEHAVNSLPSSTQKSSQPSAQTKPGVEVTSCFTGLGLESNSKR